MRPTITIILILILNFTCVFAQTPEAPNPTVSSTNYGKYADIEPNLYTGSMSIPISFGTVSHGSVSTSVGISYHTAGIRANELASEIGLGWHLQAGGAITRQIRGLDDFGVDGWLETGNQIQANNIGSDTDLIEDIRLGEVDPEPDLFTFQVNGLSGKFYLDENANVHTIPESDLRIEWNTTEQYTETTFPFNTYTYEYFLITDLTGQRYYFGQNRQSFVKEIEYTTFNGKRSNTSWFLNRIESHDGEHLIDFNYIDNYYQYYSLVDCGYVWLNNSSDCEMSLLKVEVENKLIESIISETSSINFEHFERTDLAIHDDFTEDENKPKRIFRLFVNDGELSKKVVFNNAGYFSGVDNFPSTLNGSVDNEDKDALMKHLKLNGIDISGVTGTETLQYDFEYYGINGTSNGNFFPSSPTMAVDHWGYYNGEITNNSYDNHIPTTGVINNVTDVLYIGGNSQISRDPSYNHTVAGALKSMTLPTGGTVTYTYSNNTYNTNNAVCGGLRLIETKTDDKQGNIIERDYNYDKGVLYKIPQYGASTGSNVIFNSRGYYLLNSFDGYHIGYEGVTIDYNGNGEKKVKFWTDSSPVPDGNYPPAIEEIRQHAGAIKSEEILDDDENQISYSETTQNSSYTSVGSTQMFSIEFFPNGVGGFANPNRPYKINLKHFRPASSVHILDSVKISKDYLYSSQIKNHPVEITTYDPEGTQIDNTFNQWTTIYTGENKAIVDPYLIANNIKIPWREQLNLNSTIVKETRTNFDDFGFLNLTVYPSNKTEKYFFLTGESSSFIIDTTNFNEYDNGLLAELEPPGSKVVHSFEYNNNLTLKKSCIGNLCTNYLYQGNNSSTNNSSRILKSTTAVDGTVTSFTYDNLHRIKTRLRCFDNLTTYLYDINQTDPHTTEIKTFGVDATGLSDLNSLTTIQYLDGLGRNIQTVGRTQAFDGNDQVLAIEYDNQGRVTKSYEPFASTLTTGGFIDNLSGKDYTLTTYEKSPLNRPEGIYPAEWQDSARTIITYGHNKNALINLDADFYPVASLFLTSTKDGNGNFHNSYVDTRGRTILSQISNGNTGNNTFYIYDKKNRVTQVIPPGSGFGVTSLNYFYQYDSEGKTTKKTIPSKGEVEYIYDNRDLVIGHRDPHLLSEGVWYKYAYDDFGREISNGFNNTMPTDAISAPSEELNKLSYGTSGTSKGKLTSDWNKVLGTSGTWIFKTNTYDNCGRISEVSSNNLLSGSQIADKTTLLYDGGSNVTKTTENIRAGTSASNERTVIFSSQIDDDGRKIEEFIDLDSQVERQICELSYTEKNQIKTKYQGGSSTNYLQKIDYEYLDNQMLHKVNMAANNGSDLFGYQLNFWQSDGVSGETNGTIEPQYNGNINSTIWAERDQTNQYHTYQYDFLDRLKSHYTKNDSFNTQYTYDQRGNILSLSRNENGVLIDELNYGYKSTNTNQLDTIIESADASLGYVKRNDEKYKYDENGNLKRDPQKQFSASYNHLDLAETIMWDDGKKLSFTYDASGKLLRKSILDQDGTQLQKHDYIGSFEYINNQIYAVLHSEGRLLNKGFENSLCYLFLDHQQTIDGYFDAKRIQSIGNIITENTDYEASECIDLSNGFEVKSGAEFLAHIGPTSPINESWRYDFEIKDHLGNLRMVYNGPDSLNLNIIQRQDYHPYGMSYLKSLTTDLEDKYQFNGIDYTGEFGLDWSMAKYRNLDAAIGSWGAVDPQTELGYNMSPYCALANNPISYNDPDGDWIHIAAGAVIGAGINVAMHWDDITRNGFSFGEFGKAALIGGGAGAITAATGGAAVGAGFAKGAAIGFGSGVIGDAFLQTGNAIGFGDQYNPTQTLLAGGLGAVGGGLTGHFTKAPKGSISSNAGKGSFDLEKIRDVKGSIRDDWKKMIGSNGIKDVDIHHIIPESIYDDFPELSKFFHINDAVKNGMPLPNSWHYKHPAYTRWIEDGLNYLRTTPGGINATSIGQLRSSAIYHLNQGVNSSYSTINQFWKNAPFILSFSL